MFAKGFEHRRRDGARAPAAVVGRPDSAEAAHVRANLLDGTTAAICSFRHLCSVELFTNNYVVDYLALRRSQVQCHVRLQLLAAVVLLEQAEYRTVHYRQDG